MSRSTQPNSDDLEFDAYVASLIARESKAKELDYQTFGVGVYKPATSSSKPKPNTRFLNALIRNTDGHNQALLRQEAERDRGRRRQYDYRYSKERDRKYSPERSYERERERSSSRERYRSPSTQETSRHHSCSHNKRKETANAVEKEHTKRPKRSQDDGSSSEKHQTASKMDKYFQEDYDPRLDIEEFIMDNNATIPEYVLFESTKGSTKSKKKEKKKHKKDKKKKSKHKDKDSEPSPARQSISPRPSVREWDMGKKNQASWDPQLNPYMPTYK